jgi:hypothetical protein
MMNKMITIMAAAAALVLATGNAKAVDMRRWTAASTGDPIDWDATLRYWTQAARQAGQDGIQTCANPMGIWTNDVLSLSAVAKYLGLSPDDLDSADVLYFERQALIQACLVNTFLHRWEAKYPWVLLF